MRVGESDMWVAGEEPELPADQPGSVPIAALLADEFEIFSAPFAPDLPAFVPTNLPLAAGDVLRPAADPAAPLASPLAAPPTGFLTPGGAVGTILGPLSAALGQSTLCHYQDPFTSIASAAKFLFDGASGGSFPLVQATFDACKSVVDAVGDFSGGQGLGLECWYPLGEFLDSLNDLDFTGLDEESERFIQDLRDDIPLQLLVGGLVGTSAIIESHAMVDLVEIFNRKSRADQEQRLVELKRTVEPNRTEVIVIAQDADGLTRTVSTTFGEDRRRDPSRDADR